MNDTTRSDGAFDASWPRDLHRTAASGLAPIPEGETAAPAVGLLKSAVQGAHDTLDRIADRAEPAVRQLGDSVAGAGHALRAKTARWRESGELLTKDARSSVRGSPLLFVAAAFALGAVIARITRVGR